jgi:hypothetical protein
MDESVSAIGIGILIGLGIYWVVYSLVLFLLMKVQGWHVGPIALLGSTALATLLAQIPFVGPFVATAALTICMWKASGSDLTDSMFSVVIAGALMFAFNIFVVTALMGNLDIIGLGEEEGESFDEVVEIAKTSSWSGPRGDKEKLLFLKGITVSSNQTMVLVGSGTANYSFTNGEQQMISVDKQRARVRCDNIGSNEVLMSMELDGRNYRIPLVLQELTPIAP